MVVIENAHEDIIHDSVLDYYGKRLASCSSDKTVKIFALDGESFKLLDTLRGHEAPVWRVSWAHSKFGEILASCSFDGKIIIWEEVRGKWTMIDSLSVHSGSVNSIEWSPHEFGAIILATSSDGTVSVTELKDRKLGKPIIINAHTLGVTSASWSPFVAVEEDGTTKHQQRIVTGGIDKLVKIWKYDDENKKYILEHTLEEHTGPIKDVSWSPTLLRKSYIASTSEDKNCIVWTKSDTEDTWEKNVIENKSFDHGISRVNWSLSGNILAVSTDDYQVTLLKENNKGNWEIAGNLEK
ncbi:hypothetical protein Kpol_2001p68 [Vanderwaltozyma polyspora DSM 70294]|uniref:Uncharacterized protein n=1 Tax=Vanderwaltozyma polyspora (strain ATCC 22028 / DSM 70294 / BCRC 21397 / CBS 2163 / NBRC 10782 / NRRL Y-8283 / UCD 57-17) TaxID=436907 RepID=A7TGU8_VANPO|nr:uncharacterized protein Kpol_2001p68 [Vanderwaltozyma polyspora DSM 70294]EDO18561.1 hypothetical protein Kpol_2001p68 [Vanderwaltozyma polyspora DSM 70294]